MINTLKHFLGFGDISLLALSLGITSFGRELTILNIGGMCRGKRKGREGNGREKMTSAVET